ncbi:hypothetical protein Tco_1548502 [Tanacetum coccineum]
MTRSTTKKLTEPLDEPEREFRRLRKAVWHQQQNESLAIARRNLFDDEASSSNNTRAKPLVPSKTLRGHSLPSSADAPTFAITTRSGTSTRDPPYPTPPESTTIDHASRTLEKEGPKGARSSTMQNEETPWSTIFYQPSKSSNLPFPSRVKKQKKNDKNERLLSIFKQIHINLPFLEAMIHMSKGGKVLKDLLSHKEKLELAASLVKLSEECSAIIQRSLPQKEGDTGSFTLPCLIGPLAVMNALADLKAILEMDEDKLVLIILGRPFLATARVYCADHTAMLVREQWVDTIKHDGKWNEAEDGGGSNEVHVVSFYLGTESVEPLEWKALEN